MRNLIILMMIVFSFMSCQKEEIEPVYNIYKITYVVRNIENNSNKLRLNISSCNSNLYTNETILLHYNDVMLINEAFKISTDNKIEFSLEIEGAITGQLIIMKNNNEEYDYNLKGDCVINL